MRFETHSIVLNIKVAFFVFIACVLVAISFYNNPSSAVAAVPIDCTPAAVSARTATCAAEDVALHATSADCWTIIDTSVYNLTGYRHPGGASRITPLCGSNGTSAFRAEHGNESSPAQALASMKIGTYVDNTAPGFYSVATLAITSNSAQVTWVTDESADTQVEYGVTNAYGSLTAVNTSMVTNHTVTLTGLTSNTTYNYRLKSKDAAGNVGVSGNYTFTTASSDSISPSDPTGLTASPVSSTQINLSWTASTDNVGVTGYRIERCTGVTCTNFVQIATGASVTYVNTGLSANTTYRYRVLAVDASGNLSAYSTITNATTQSVSTVVDATPPTTPTGLKSTTVSYSQINLSWNTSTDDVGVVAYRIYRCLGTTCTASTQVGTTATLSYSDNGLTVNTSYRYRVRAVDASGKTSSYSSAVTGTTAGAQSLGSYTSADVAQHNVITNCWTIIDANVYDLSPYRNTHPGGSSVLTPLCGVDGTSAFRAKHGTTANPAAALALLKIGTLTVPATDATPPTTPGNMNATAFSATRVDLAWSASTDDMGVTGYRVESCTGATCTNFAQIATPTGTSYSHTGLSANTTYRFRVRATDASGKFSSYSTIMNATTPAVQPTTFTAADVGTHNTQGNCWTIIDTSVYNLTSYMSGHPGGSSVLTPLCGVDGTSAFRAKHGTTANPAAALALLKIGTLTVPATDATPPTTPGNMNATAFSATRVDLAWSASTDDMGVTGYRVESCTGATCTNFAQIATPTGTSYSHTGLSANTTYRFRVRATDASGKFSSYSTIMNATTPAVQPTTFTAADVGTHNTQGNCWTIIDTSVYNLTSYMSGHPGGSSVLTPLCGVDGTSAFRAKHGTTANPAAALALLKIGTLTVPATDATPPTTPGNMNATAFSATRVDLAWSASTDDMGVTGYRVESCTGATCTNFAQIATPTGTSYSHTGLSANTTYRFRVRATDASGKFSSYSTIMNATTPAVQPTTFTAADVGTHNTQGNCWTIIDTSVYNLTSYMSGHPGGSSVLTPLCGVDGTSAFRAKHGTTANPAAALALLKIGTYVVPPPATDTVPPTAPTNVVTTAVSASQINLSWAPSTDASGQITGYRVESCTGATCTNFAQIATPTGTSYSSTGLTPDTTYLFRVSAVDNGNNVSPYSSVATDRTQLAVVINSYVAADIAKHSTSGNCWTVISKNVYNLTSYISQHPGGSSVLTPLCGVDGTSAFRAKHGTTANPAAALASLKIGTLSGVAPEPATVKDTVPPTAPKNLSAQIVSATQVNLAWTASTDAVGVSKYQVSRCAGTTCTNFALVATAPTTKYSDTGLKGLSSGTIYRYIVSAIDAAGNVSANSNIALGTTTTPAPVQVSGYTVADVGKHGTAASCWSIVDKNVYDLTSWKTQHPGGSSMIVAMCGKDGSEAFHRYHGTKASPANALAQFKLGALVSSVQTVSTTPSTVTPAPLTKTLAVGDTDLEVVLLKIALRQAGYMSFVGTPTNIFGSITKEALIRFQKAKGLSATKGIVTTETRTALNAILSTLTTTTTGSPAVAGEPVFTIWLARDVTHPQVSLLQQLLIREGVYPEATVSGYFGAFTELALKRLQTKYGIVSEGTPYTTGYGATGPRTRAKLNELSGALVVAPVTHTPTIFTPNSYGVGSIVYTSDRLFVRPQASVIGGLLGVQAKGSRGNIIGGPVVADGHTWWKISYNQGFTGWSVQDWLSLTSVPVDVTPVPSTPVVSTPTPKPVSAYTKATVASHASRSNCWSIVDGVVYDFTAWIPLHPGGEATIEAMCGIDGSSLFHGQHGYELSPTNALKPYKLGALGS